jgi:putative transposase
LLKIGKDDLARWRTLHEGCIRSFSLRKGSRPGWWWCAWIDKRVRTFLERPIEGDWPYLWIDATYVKVREAGRIVSVAVTIAVAVNTDGRREVLGMSIGAAEAETFWVEFLRKLERRGLAGVKLVISDAHEGIKAAVARVCRATWQRSGWGC